MKCCQFLIFVTFLIVYNFLGYAQQKQARLFDLEGVVMDASGWGIPGANVVVRKEADATLVAFVPTNTRGEFSVKLPEGTYHFQVSSVGFQAQHRTAALTRTTARKLDLEFILLEDEKVLDEVLIQEKRLPVIERKDTLVFDAAYFAGAGDRKAIDILRKVPGIDVRQDGSIYYKGKRI
ncbi:MAG: carboxypeptidase regulatory-like domain-containing protein, partial [Bernardetiaceae bacterium]